MPIKRAKSVDQLYERCAGYDLVVVPDAPLGSALNRRLDQAHFGPFAITPRRLAARRRETAEDRLAFLELVEQTEVDWKQAAYAVGNILQCWEHQGTVDAILEYDEYVDTPTRAAVDCLADLNTTSRRLTDYTIDDVQDVAVVGVDRLTTLERSILPSEYDEVDPFTDETFDQPPFRVFESPAAIVDTLLDTITADNADDVGIVLDEASAYSSLVESALEAADVPYYGGPGFADDTHHRAFLQLLRAAHDGRDTRVKDVRPVLTRLDLEIGVEHVEKRLRDLDKPATNWLRDFATSVNEHTFDSALRAYEDAAGSSLDAFREELSRLGIRDEPLTRDGVNRLAFYLQSYEVPVDRENEGVLLADAKSAAHVDRPLVFYVGLDEGWTHSSPRRPWVDREREYEQNVEQFQLLLQNGQEQYYLVQDTAGGTPITPCLYFEDLLDEEFERFSDLDSIPHSRTRRRRGKAFEAEPVDATRETTSTISQSSLSTYVNCPRDYFFSRIVEDPDAAYLTEGSLFHDFAEFYVNHPGTVDEETIDEVVDVMVDEVQPFLRDVDRPVRRTKYRVGVETIVEFLDANPTEPAAFVTAGWMADNYFAEYFDRPVDSSETELWFENDELGIEGKIDLVRSPTHLVDYKSGSEKSAYSVVKNSAVDPPNDTPDFQALLYLAHLRSEQPGQRLQFTFLHFLETLEEALDGDADLDDCLTTLTYHPVAFEEYVAGREMFDELVAEGANDCQKTLSQVEFEDYRAVVSAHEFPDTRDSDELVESELGQALVSRMRTLVGDYKYVETGYAQILRYLRDVRDRNYFADDLDAFEAFVEERIDELDRRRRGDERFPVEDFGSEPNYRHVDNRDLLLETDD